MAKIRINSGGGRGMRLNGQGAPRAPINAPQEVVTPTLDTPGSLVAVDQSSSQINLSWLAVANATAYVLERSANGATVMAARFAVAAADANVYLIDLSSQPIYDSYHFNNVGKEYFGTAVFEILKTL